MSFDPKHYLAQVIVRGLAELTSVKPVDDGVCVTTHCMYPSNGLVQVTVRGGVDTIVASDEGGAVGEAISAGIPIKDYTRTLAHLIREQGLMMREGVIYSPQMPIEAAPLAILHVANASQETAKWLYEHMKIKRTRDFKAILAAFLKSRFEDRVIHDAVIVGHSNKPHKFANVIALVNGSRLIIDPVINDASSINARVVANLDVKAVGDPRISQRIIYDDEEVWTPADLNLLQVGATVIPFSRSSEVIERLASSNG
jgi:hypothetical protein